MKPMKPCKRCGHAYAEHATDINHLDALRCFHGAATGDGCADKYCAKCDFRFDILFGVFEDRCANYIDPEVK